MDAQPPLVVHAIHHLVIGGMENGVVNLINRIPPRRYRHCVICMEDFSDFRGRLTDPAVPVLAMHKSRSGAAGLYRRLYSLFRTIRPAILHSRNLSGLDALPPAVLARVPGRIHSEHGRDIDDIDGELLRPRMLRRIHAPIVQRYVTVSKDLQSYLQQRIGVAPSRITQIYNGVDTERFSPSSIKPAGVLPDSFGGTGKVIVGTIGRLQPIKNQIALVRALARLFRSEPSLRTSVRLAIVGGGPSRADLDASIQAEGLRGIVWLPGAREDVMQVLRCFDVFVLPSLNEGISNTILEAMATGLPVVASRVGGNGELVLAGLTGALYAQGKDDALEVSLRPYLSDSELRSAHGSAGRANAVLNYSLDAMVQRYLAVYDALLAPAPAIRGSGAG